VHPAPRVGVGTQQIAAAFHLIADNSACVCAVSDEQVSGERIRELLQASPPVELDPATEQLLAQQQQPPQVGVSAGKAFDSRQTSGPIHRDLFKPVCTCICVRLFLCFSRAEQQRHMSRGCANALPHLFADFTGTMPGSQAQHA